MAPTQPVPVVVEDQGARRFKLMRWGFWPSFVKDPKTVPLLINVARQDGSMEGTTPFRVFVKNGIVRRSPD